MAENKDITKDTSNDTLKEPVDFTGIDIEAEYEKIKNGWNVNDAETLEEKKKEVERNILACREIRREIAEYMETDEYKETYESLKQELKEKGGKMDPEKIYMMRRGDYCTYIEYTDAEKIALGIKGTCKELKRLEMVEKYIPKGEFIEGTDYIFFSIENGGFASRNILVPSKEFEKIHGEELKMLRKNAETSIKREDGVTVHTLFRVLDGKDLDERGCGCYHSEPNEFDVFSSGMMTYAECESHMGVHYGYLRKGDFDMDEEREWYIKSICNGYGYFNPKTGAKTLIEMAEKNGCTVSESFMFLEKYINCPRERMNYQYETPGELREAILKGEI